MSVKKKIFAGLFAFGLLAFSGMAKAEEQESVSILDSLKDITIELPAVEGEFDPEMLKETCESATIGGTWQWTDPEDPSQGGTCTLSIERIAEMIKDKAREECESKGGEFVVSTDETYCRLPESAFYNTIKETLAEMNNDDSFLEISDGRALCYYLNGTWDENSNKCNLCK